MAKCTCPKCDCGDTYKCLHHPDGSFCKCCVDDFSEEDGMLYHRPDLMEGDITEEDEQVRGGMKDTEEH